jgi:hypothetical protein
VTSGYEEATAACIKYTCIWQRRGVGRVGGPPSPALRKIFCLAGSEDEHKAARISIREAWPLDSMHQNQKQRQESSKTCAASQKF